MVELVEWVSDPDKAAETGEKIPWEVRNRNYLERIKTAPIDALNISCADKTANMQEMLGWMERGYRVEEFTSRDLETQLGKFKALYQMFEISSYKRIYCHFKEALSAMCKM